MQKKTVFLFLSLRLLAMRKPCQPGGKVAGNVRGMKKVLMLPLRVLSRVPFGLWLSGSLSARFYY